MDGLLAGRNSVNGEWESSTSSGLMDLFVVIYLVQKRVELTGYVHNIVSASLAIEGTGSIFLTSSNLFSGEMESGYWVSRKNFRVEVIMSISGLCTVDAERWNRLSSVLGLTTGYSLIYSNIFMRPSYYKPELGKIIVVNLGQLL